MIIEMNEHHIAALSDLEKQCFSTPWSKASLQEELSNSCALFLVDEETDGTIRGYIGCHIILEEGYITNVAVSPSYRRKKVGYNLISTLLQQAKDRELSFLTLEVRASNNAAISLYRTAGFVPVGVRKGYYSSPAENALLMTYYIEKKPERYK